MEEEKKNKRKAIILMIIGVITLIGLVVGATYAYFSAQVGTGDKAQINAKAGTTDNLTFATTGPITITANQTNFAEGENSLYSSATATAHLIAGDDDNIATEHYYLYLQIDANNLTYTVGKDQPELIMEITDPNKQPYTEPIAGLEYKENITDGKGVTYSGYDITEAKGLFAIAKNYEIIASPNRTDTWTIKVTFLNLATDQHENTDKTLTGKLIIQKEERPTSLADACTGENLSDCIQENYQYDGNIYFHNGNLLAPDTIPDLEDKSIIGGYEIVDNYKDEYSQIKDDLIKKICNGQDVNIDVQNENCYDEKWNDISKYYLEYKGNETLYDTYKKALQQAIDDKYVKPNVLDAADDSYRYAGSSDEVKNFVCLDGKDTDDGTCGDDDTDLYRIIGLFKNKDNKYEIKLIKYDYATSEQLGIEGAYENVYKESELSINDEFPAKYYKGNSENIQNIGSYYWINSDESNVEWSESKLRKVNLNDYYLNNYLKNTKGLDIDNLIVNHTWKTKYYNKPEIIAKEIYEYEMGLKKLPDDEFYDESLEIQVEETVDKIGLMYASDYGYAVSPNKYNWSKSLYSYNNITSSNWMYMGLYEWTITLVSSSTAYSVSYDGYIYGPGDTNALVSKLGRAVRPCFYLSSDVQIKSGDGSKNSPYRLSVD